MSRTSLIGMGIIGVLFPAAMYYELPEAGACLIAGLMFIIPLKD
jgi:hypothetical protein